MSMIYFIYFWENMTETSSSEIKEIMAEIISAS